ncbi:MAG TPA: AEC family transporter [Chloroflexota bacterium]|nr:AEC family transporter [Chloroflexota bacterium]
MWTAAAALRVQRNVSLLGGASFALLALLAARDVAAGAAGAPPALAVVVAAWGGTWTVTPAAVVAMPLFLRFGLTVVAGVLVRRSLAVWPEAAALGERSRRAINSVVLWVTLPALVFDTVHGTRLGPDLLQGPAAAICGMAGTAVLAWLILGRLYGRTPTTGGLVLAASAGSVSFLGVPVVRALFDASEARVGVYFAVLNVPLALLSAALISRGIGVGDETARRARTSVARYALDAVRQFFSLPATWALVAAVVLQDVALPAGARQVLHALGASVAPTVMFALGLGLRFERSLAPYRMALPAAVIKLAVSPLIVFACAKALGLSGAQLAVVSLQGAMPTQVLSVVIAERYRLDSRMVGLALAMNTALAFVLLPFLVGALEALGAG